MRFPSVTQVNSLFSLFLVLILFALPVRAVDIYLLHTNNTNGALENCLCPGKSYGSLEKRVHYIREWLNYHSNTILVDAGDFLSSTSNTLKDSIAFRGYELMPYDVVALGDQEFFRGIPFLSELMNRSDLPFVASNLQQPQLPNLQSELIIELEGISFGIFSVLDPSIFRFYPKSVSETVEILPFENVVTQQAAALQHKSDVVIMLSHLGIEKDRELAGSVEGLDIIVGGHTQTILQEPEKIRNTLIVQAGKDGYYVGELKLTFDDEKELQSYNGKLIPMDITLPNDSVMVDMIVEYNRLKRQSLTRRVERILPVPTEYLVAPVEKCGSCHPKKLEHWLTTPHAASFATLEHEHKHKSPDCLACHTTGFGRDDGYLNYNITAGLKTVNCTECHSVPEEHLEEPYMVDANLPTEENCLRCHDQMNSPSFEFALFKEQIRHPVEEELVEVEPAEEKVALIDVPPKEISEEPVVEEEIVMVEALIAADEAQEDTVSAGMSKLPEPEVSVESEVEPVADEAETSGETSVLYLTYIVVEGESLWKLSEFFLGDGKRWLEIYKLNRENISDPNLIREGQELLIPLSQEEK